MLFAAQVMSLVAPGQTSQSWQDLRGHVKLKLKPRSLQGSARGPFLSLTAKRATTTWSAPHRSKANWASCGFLRCLTGIGSWMVDDTASSGRVEHTDSLGRSAYARAVACGYSGGAGENLAAGAEWDTGAEAVAAWKASAGHNANLLSKYYTEVGVARLYRPGSAYGWYWAMEFGSNGSAAPAAAAATATATLTPAPATATPTSPATATATPSPSAVTTSIAPATPTGSQAAPKAPGVSAQGVTTAQDEPTTNPNRPWRIFLPGY